MARLTKDDILKIQSAHNQWLINQGGKRAVYTDCTLYDLDLSCFNFDQVKFSKCKIQDVVMPQELYKASFKDVQLVDARFVDSNLTKARFTDSLCVASDFTNAVLEKAKFKLIRIQNCNFTGSNLTGSNLKIYHVGQWEAHICPDWTSIGCQSHPNEAWRNFTDDEIDAMATHALAYWKANKDMIFAIMDSFKK